MHDYQNDGIVMVLQLIFFIKRILNCVLLFSFSVPAEVKELYIPNPHNDQLQFYNQLLFDLYHTTYELISPMQFKNYVISQRYHRWLIMKEARAVDLFYRNFASADSMEGNAINLRNYTNDDYSSFTARDVKRVENTYSYLQQLQRKLVSVKEKITKLRSNLYDMNHVIKPRKANELLFYDGRMSCITDMETDIKAQKGKLNFTLQCLRRKFFKSDVESMEEKRKLKRKAQNQKKDEKLKDECLMCSCVEILQLVAPEASRDINCNKVVEENKINLQVDKADFEKQTVSLTPRYHLSAITYLIENNVFIDDALKKAIAVCEKLKKSGKETKIANMAKKEKKDKKDAQNKIKLPFCQH